MKRTWTSRALRLLLWLVALLFAGGYLFFQHEVLAPLRPVEAESEPFTVAPGASVEAIGQQLTRLGLVRHPLVFRLLVLRMGAASRLKAGEYTLEGPLSLTQIVELLERGAAVRHAVTFPEGRNLEEMAVIAAQHDIPAEEFLAIARDPSPIHDLDPLATDLEGYLFPDTYDVSERRRSAATLVARMLQRFRDVVGPELPRLEAHQLSLRQAVTLASLVELETAQASERPRIAAVFLNRLERHIPLQTDPTVIYALRRAGRWDGNIRRGDLQIDSPYNTYRIQGLPPGPIASPGRAALLAVLEPADVEDLYFVSRNDGTHEFSATLRDHERAVDRYQRRRPRLGS